MRDRVRGLRRVRGRDLIAHAKNWRRHAAGQRKAFSALLERVGFAGALLARGRADGGLELIDGHMRAEELGEEEVPVLVLDVDEEEAELLLATHDRLGELAVRDDGAWRELIEGLGKAEKDLAHWLGSFAAKEMVGGKEALCERSVMLAGSFQVVVECENEDEQREVFEGLKRDGRKCRLLCLGGY